MVMNRLIPPAQHIEHFPCLISGIVSHWNDRLHLPNEQILFANFSSFVKNILALYIILVSVKKCTQDILNKIYSF